MKKRLLLVLLALVIGAKLLYAQNNGERRELEASARQYEAYFNARDAKGVASMYATNALYSNNDGLPRLLGVAAIENDQAKGFAEWKSSQLNMQPEDYTAMPGGYMAVAGKYAVKGQAANEKPFTGAGRYFNLYKKDKDQWKIQAVLLSPPGVSDAPEADIKAIKKLLVDETTAFLRGDAQAQIACWKLDAATRLLASDNGEVYFGDAELIRNGMSEMTDGKVVHANHSIRVSGTMGYATFDQIMTWPDGKTNITREVRVLDKVDGDWKIAVVSAHSYKQN